MVFNDPEEWGDHDRAEIEDQERQQAEEQAAILAEEGDRYDQHLRTLSSEERGAELDDYEENEREIRAETMPDWSNHS